MKPIKFKSEQNPVKLKRVRKIIRKFLPVGIIIGILIAIALFLLAKSSSDSVVSYILSGTSLKSNNGMINVLLLGTAGANHDGPNLTDTIMVASYNLKTNKLHLISIPRDLWIPEFKAKANYVYQLGLNQNNGLNFTKTVMGNIVGLPLRYSLRIDFQGFQDAVDAIGGVDVEVANTFDDYNYPVAGKEDDLCGYQEKEIDFSKEEADKLNIPAGKMKVFVSPDGKIATDSAQEDIGAKYFTCRYEHIHFDQGLTHMNGETALKFVRSRHGINGEASDFSRSKRQEQVIAAIREKLLSFETLTNPQKLSDLVKALGKSIDTDISIKDAIEFYKLSKKLSETKTIVLDDSPRAGLPNNRSSLLIHPPAGSYGGAYVLISQDDDFSIIQGYIRNVFLKDEATTSARPSSQ